jgi:hypothetical protein
MEINIGDRVRYLNDVGGGKVIAILPDKRAMILDESGFEIPMLFKELVIIESKSMKPQKEGISTRKEPEPEKNIHKELFFFPQGNILSGNNVPKAYFAFVPQSKTVTESKFFEAHIINDSNYVVFYTLYENNQLNVKCLDAGVLSPNSQVLAMTFEKNKLASVPEIFIHLCFFSKDSLPLVKPWQSLVQVDSSVFERETAFKRSNFFEKPVIMYRLTDHSTDTKTFEKALEQLTQENVQQVKKKIILDTTPKKQPEAKPKPEELREIDLHIQSLVESTSGMTPKELLDIQMGHFRVELDKAIKDQVKRIVFIHGLGNGTLKNEVRRTLDREFKKYEYHDASFKEYGFGATMVMIRS